MWISIVSKNELAAKGEKSLKKVLTYVSECCNIVEVATDKRHKQKSLNA